MSAKESNVLRMKELIEKLKKSMWPTTGMMIPICQDLPCSDLAKECNVYE